MTPQEATGDNARPMDKTYMKWLRFCLYLIDSWPYKELGSKKRTLFFRNGKVLLTCGIFFVVSGISYLRKNFAVLDFPEQAQSIFMIFGNLVQVQRLFLTQVKSYKKTVVMLVREVHLAHHKDRDEYSKMIFNKIEKFFEYFAVIFLVQPMFGVSFYNFMPVIINYRHGMFGSNKPENRTLEHATYLDLPFDYTSRVGVGYITVVILNICSIIDSAFIFVSYDLLMIIILVSLWGHLKILRHRLENFPKPTRQAHTSTSKSIENSAWFTDEENIRITEMFKENIEYHKFLKKYMDQVTVTFGLSWCVYHAYYLFCGCILLIQSTQSDGQEKFKYLPVAIIANSQLVQLSLMLELIGSASEILKDVAYGIPWESMNVKNQKILLFYLANLQETFTSKALGLLLVGVQTMAAIMKTTFSYFMLVRALAYTKEQ